MADIKDPIAWCEEMKKEAALPGGHVFVTGVPGAGKTTEAQRMADEMGLPLISVDGIPRTHGASPPDTEDVRKLVKEYLDTPHIIEGSQIMGMNQEDLYGSRVIFIDQPRDTIVDRLVSRGLVGDDGRHLIGEDARKKIESEHDQISQAAVQFLKRVNPEIISPKPVLIKKASSNGIRMSKEASMKKKAQPKGGVGGVQQVQGVQPVQGVGGVGSGVEGGRKQQQQQELEAWNRWIQDRNKEDFTFLLDSYAPFMNYMGQRHLQTAKTSGTLPPSTIKADMIQNFHRAMETYDPNKGQLNTHIGNHLRHTGRFVRTYANIGKMPDPRSRMVWQYKDRETVLTERLGRQPSSIEMADDLGMSVKDIELLRTEIRKDIIVDPTTAGMGNIAPESPKAMEQLNFLHMELNPEQQNVLEYTYGIHGRHSVENNEELAQIIGISPQKVRAIKRQIARKYEKRYR